MNATLMVVNAKNGKTTMSKVQIDNSDPTPKIMLRKWLIEQQGGIEYCNVLEAFAGMGKMHDACYVGANAHLGFELRKVNRPTWLQGDNRVLIQQNVQGWTLYDLDAYGSPWTLAGHIHRLREPGIYGMALTDGSKRALTTGLPDGFFRQRIGYKGMPPSPLLVRWYMDIARWLIEDWKRYGVTVHEAKYMESKESRHVTYFAMMVEKK